MVATSLLLTSMVLVSGVYSKGKNYAPVTADCPSSFLRPATSISKEEQDYINGRWQSTQDSLRSFLQHANLNDINIDDILWKDNDTVNTVNVGLALPGGGFKALMLSGGAIQALDNRENNKRSPLKGLLQASSHISAVSGGSWLVGSMYLNDFPTVTKLRDNGKIWKFEQDLVLPNGMSFTTYADYGNYAFDVLGKATNGFPVSITDVYGRLLSYKFIDNNENHGAGVTWSDIEDKGFYKSRTAPYPIIVAQGRDSTDRDIKENATLYEITPHEIGSYDPSLRAFANLKYLGTTLDNGKPKDNKCYTNFDNAGFVMATSSNIFNQAIRKAAKSSNNIRLALGSLSALVLDTTDLDVAQYQPNPFKNYHNPVFKTSTRSLTDSDSLSLADGASDNEYVPYWPLLKKERNVDFIISIDTSGNTKYNWPSGKSLVTTYARAKNEINKPDPSGPSTVAFPKVPDENTFLNLGLTTRPTFFGCYAGDYSDRATLDSGDFSQVPPLILYLANQVVSHATNYSTLDTQFKTKDIQNLFENGFDLMSQPSDDNWNTCVACAVIQRERERQGDYSPTNQCKQCFDKYCWDGKTDSRDPGEYGARQQSTGSDGPLLKNGNEFKQIPDEPATSASSENSSNKPDVNSSISATSQISSDAKPEDSGKSVTKSENEPVLNSSNNSELKEPAATTSSSNDANSTTDSNIDDNTQSEDSENEDEN